MRLIDWKTCVMLTSNAKLYSDTASLWSKQFDREKIDVHLKSFQAGAFQSEVLEDVGKSGRRVILILADAQPDTLQVAASVSSVRIIVWP